MFNQSVIPSGKPDLESGTPTYPNLLHLYVPHHQPPTPSPHTHTHAHTHTHSYAGSSRTFSYTPSLFPSSSSRCYKLNFTFARVPSRSLIKEKSRLELRLYWTCNKLGVSESILGFAPGERLACSVAAGGTISLRVRGLSKALVLS